MDSGTWVQSARVNGSWNYVADNLRKCVRELWYSRLEYSKRFEKHSCMITKLLGPRVAEANQGIVNWEPGISGWETGGLVGRI